MPIWDINTKEPIIPLNKENVLKEIKEQLPEPWMWLTIDDRIIEGDLEKNPRYDILVIKKKNVNEEIVHEVRFGHESKENKI